MRRREFIKAGSLAITAGAIQPKELSSIFIPKGPHVTQSDMERFIGDLDAAMARIGSTGRRAPFVEQVRGRALSVEEGDRFRRGMRTLLLLGSIGDLPLAGRTHPAVQQRLRYSAAEMHVSVTEMADELDSMSPTRRADIKRALRDDPHLADRMLEAFDREAEISGVNRRRRLHLRALGKQVLDRMSHSSGLLIDEYVSKSRKVKAEAGADVETRRLMRVRMGEAAFESWIQEVEQARARWEQEGAENIPIGYAPIGGNGQADPPDDERSDAMYRTALRMLGIGAIMVAGGLLLIKIDGGEGLDDDFGILGKIGVFFGITVGPILIVIGLLYLLIAAGVDATDGAGSGAQQEDQELPDPVGAENGGEG